MPTPLGQLIRAGTDIYHGMALACLVAGDRHHLAAEIRPRLESGAIVLSDRYLPASLVLQRVDALDWDTIWQLNTPVVVPDLAVILNAKPQILARSVSCLRHLGPVAFNPAIRPGVSAESARDRFLEGSYLGICIGRCTALTSVPSTGREMFRLAQPAGKEPFNLAATILGRTG